MSAYARIANMKYKRAGALGAFALLLASPALAQTPVEYDEDAASIYYARVVTMEHVGELPCPPEHICMSSFFDLTLEPLEPIGNSPDIGTQTFRVIQHAQYIEGLVLVIVARRDMAGKWHLIDRTRMERRACFDDPSGDVEDNFDDPENDWYAEHDEDSQETCIYGPDRPAP